ncbi:MAG: efflux transporter outer membrane subunit [Verrucomicrobia bacterium]|nr:efflux transporter outer membrane subunit [Verrucomicrobiota bacterium]
MKIRIPLLLLAGSCIVLLNGCISVGPDYEVPETPMPDAWHEAVQGEFKSGDPDLQTWWTVFGDETLNGLITKASTNNLNLKTAAARIEQAAALRGVSASQYWPDIVADASASAIKTSPVQGSIEDEFYQAGLSMAWELDLWGRIRRSVESADASLQASVENYRDILVVLYADIARNYIDVRTLQERIILAEDNLEAQIKTMELTENRFNSGLVPRLDVSQSKLNRSRTESQIPPLKQSLIVAINRLSVLTGDMPYALLQELETQQPTIPACTGAQIARGLPADLLRQRPDIRRAERELASQNARIGATKADLYPTLTLPGTLAIQSLGGGGDFLSSDNVTYGFGPQLRWNIFNGKRIRSQIAAEEAGTQAALHIYEQTVLLALEEVEGSMAAYANEQDRVKSLKTAAEAAQTSVDLVMELYKSGLTDFQNVLNMEQALLEQQDALATSHGLISLDLVGIYKALGGGWTPPEEEPEE